MLKNKIEKKNQLKKITRINLLNPQVNLILKNTIKIKKLIMK
jgi:hypothetical protein